MLRRLYDWTMGLSAHRHAMTALFGVSFIESSVFPIPPDVLMIPMVLARRSKAMAVALIATAGSVLGAMLGYWIGAALMDSLGQAVLAAYGKQDAYAQLAARFADYGGWAVLFAALTLVGLMERGVPIPLALVGTVLVMIALAMLIERMMLRHLVNQEGIILFMATIGLNFLLEGAGQIAWGSNVKVLDIGIPDQSFEVYGILLNQFDLFAAGTGAVLVTTLAVFFQKTTIGRALRAVADDHQAALSVGIPLRTIWIVVWSVAGFVALVAGIMWGSKAGVQFSLSLIALKALPVLILGGFESIPGAIVGGLTGVERDVIPYASVTGDRARLAGLNPAGVICEIMNEDGSMARLDDLVGFARKHGLKVIEDERASQRSNPATC